VLSLPLYPRLREEDVVRVAALVNSFQPFLRKRR
jgi:dTDP-4-amino-4,6-dideoxygalactose transaminase